jgi:hypothetical protein
MKNFHPLPAASYIGLAVTAPDAAASVMKNSHGATWNERYVPRRVAGRKKSAAKSAALKRMGSPPFCVVLHQRFLTKRNGDRFTAGASRPSSKRWPAAAPAAAPAMVAIWRT